jgi:hypothetical protein
MKTKDYLSLICILAVSLILIGISHGGGQIERCIICGMDVSKYTHVKYVVTTTEGKKYTTCGVQCGLMLHLQLGNKFKSATATGLITHRTINAKKAWYVYKSSVISDMAPGYIAFTTKSNAQKFANGFGGKVVTYDEAMEIKKRESGIK